MRRGRPNLALLRRMGAEAMECGAFVDWFARTHQDLLPALTHIPNERRNKLEAIRMQLMGVRKGVADYLLAVPRGAFPGMWLEFKAAGQSLSAVSQDQRTWLRLMAAAGFFTAVARGVDQAIEITEAYLAEGVTEAHWYRAERYLRAQEAR